MKWVYSQVNIRTADEGLRETFHRVDYYRCWVVLNEQIAFPIGRAIGWASVVEGITLTVWHDSKKPS